MERVRIRLNRIQQDALLMPTTSMTSIRTKQLMDSEYHNYPENDHYIDQMICEHGMYVEQNDLINSK